MSDRSRRLRARSRTGAASATWPSDRLSRRQLLRRIARGRAPPPRWPRSSPRAAQPATPAAVDGGRRRRATADGRAGPAARRDAPEPTPVADAGGRAPRLELGRVHRRGRHPVVREEVQASRSLRTSSTPMRRCTRGSATARARLRHHASRRRSTSPALVGERLDPAARPSPDPEQGEPRGRVAEPGLRPGQRAFDAVHVVDDRRRLDTAKIKET